MQTSVDHWDTFMQSGILRSRGWTLLKRKKSSVEFDFSVLRIILIIIAFAFARIFSL